MATRTLAVCLAVVACAGAGVRAQGWPAVYDPMTVLDLTLVMDPQDWTTVVHDETNEIEVPALFGAEGEPAILVSVRRKSSRPLGEKVGLKIDIDEFVNGQSWNGAKKLSLENGADTSVLAEGLAWYVHRASAEHMSTRGVSYVPGLAAWVSLTVNGTLIGVYANVEQPDKQFLVNRGMFVPGGTWLYKMDDIGAPVLESGSGVSPAHATLCYSPFMPLRRACPSPDAATFVAQVSSLIDVDAMLTYGAVEAFSSNPDGLFTHAKNSFFADFSSAPREYVPWDLDAVFTDRAANIYGTERRRRGRVTLSQTAFQRLILSNPAFSPRYEGIMGELIDGPLNPASLLPFLDALEPVLTPALDADPNSSLDGSTPAEAFANMRQWLVDREANVRAQLGG